MHNFHENMGISMHFNKYHLGSCIVYLYRGTSRNGSVYVLQHVQLCKQNNKFNNLLNISDSVLHFIYQNNELR